MHQLVSAFDALVSAELTHPALAAPLATGISGVDAFLVQDYVGAESLDLAVREYGPAPPADGLRVATQLAGALDFAAAASIVHGSLHPRDILLSSDDARLTGIGVTRALVQVGITAPVRRPYTAPERLAGAVWDRRADVFSLAALIHELLWGRRIAGTGAQAVENLTAIAGADLAALRATFERALAEDPDARFATALEFAEALQNACPGLDAAPAAPARKRPVRKVERAARPESLPPREIEPTLPLDSINLDEPAPQSRTLGDFELNRAERSRYADVEMAPAIVDVDLPPPLPPDPMAFDLPAAPAPFEPGVTAPAGLITGNVDAMSALERTRSAVWPLVLALAVGGAIGFAAGYFTGAQHDRSAPATAASAPVPAGREFTESSIPEAPKAAPAPEKSQVSSDKSSVAAKPEPRAASPQLPVPSPVAGPGRLLVRSTPAGATVTVDGREYGQTPIAVRDLAVGAHEVSVARAGFSPSDRRIVLTRPRPTQSMLFELQQPSRAAAAAASAAARAAAFAGALTVDSRPPGAKVFLDGKLVGSTPLSLQTVTAGEHAVRIEREGYRRWSSQVRIVATEQNRVTASLEK